MRCAARRPADGIGGDRRVRHGHFDKINLLISPPPPPAPPSSLFPVSIQVQTKVEAKFQRDVLRGDDSTEIRVRLVEMLQDTAPQDDD